MSNHLTKENNIYKKVYTIFKTASNIDSIYDRLWADFLFKYNDFFKVNMDEIIVKRKTYKREMDMNHLISVAIFVTQDYTAGISYVNIVQDKSFSEYLGGKGIALSADLPILSSFYYYLGKRPHYETDIAVSMLALMYGLSGLTKTERRFKNRVSFNGNAAEYIKEHLKETKKCEGFVAF